MGGGVGGPEEWKTWMKDWMGEILDWKGRRKLYREKTGVEGRRTGGGETGMEGGEGLDEEGG
jgi:hypothetical protein